jgi:hypothetical protein
MSDDLTINLMASEPPPAGPNVRLDAKGVTEYGAFSLAVVAEPLAPITLEMGTK